MMNYCTTQPLRCTGPLRFSTRRFIGAATLALLLLAAACQKTNDKNPLLIGQWQGAEWLILDKPADVDVTKVQFEFKEDGSYTAQFGSQYQKGAWRTEKDKLYTTEENREEIMVKILKIDATTLQFEMNRGGQKETLKLAKE